MLILCLAGNTVRAQQADKPMAGKQAKKNVHSTFQSIKSDLKDSTRVAKEKDKATQLRGKTSKKINEVKKKPQTILKPEEKDGTQMDKDIKSDIQQTEKEVTKLPIDRSTLQGEKHEATTLKSKATNEKNSLKTTLDTLRHPHLKHKVKEAVKSEKEEVKQSFTGYKNGFKISKFSEIKIDTGDIPLEKEGLLKRGNQFIKSNSSGTDLPSSFPSKLNKFDDKQFLKPLATGSALPKSFSTEAAHLENSTKKIEDVQNNKLSEEQLKGDVNGLSKKLQSSDNKKISQASNTIGKLTDKDIFAKGKLQLLDAKKVYSEKYIKEITDSLGLQKADSVLKIAAPLLKQEVSKDEMLQTINNSMSDKAKPEGVGFNTKDGTLNSKDADKINELPKQFSGGDLSKLQLPQGVLQELPPLRGNIVDKKYLDIIDSVKKVNLKAQNLKMNESNLTGKLKSIVVKDKPKFLDKTYMELILGLYQNNTFTVFQASPSFAYHFTDKFSLGIGPSVLVKLEDKKKLNTVLGFRYYTKVEFYNRRIYLQLEDTMTPSALNRETLQTSVHTILVGGGVLLPLFRNLALNPCILYRVNTDHSAANPASPWVFRVGLSSMKLKK